MTISVDHEHFQRYESIRKRFSQVHGHFHRFDRVVCICRSIRRFLPIGRFVFACEICSSIRAHPFLVAMAEQAGDSARSRELKRQASDIAKEIVDRGETVSAAKRRLSSQGVDREAWPSDEQIYRRRAYVKNQRARMAGLSKVPSTMEDVTQWVESHSKCKATTPDTFFTQTSSVVHTSGTFCLPFSWPAALQTATEVIKRSCDEVSLVLDATHDVCHQTYKLFGVSVAALHNIRGEWRDTAVPLCFAVMNEESKAARAASGRCLQHVKANMAKQRSRWLHGN